MNVPRCENETYTKVSVRDSKEEIQGYAFIKTSKIKDLKNLHFDFPNISENIPHNSTSQKRRISDELTISGSSTKKVSTSNVEGGKQIVFPLISCCLAFSLYLNHYQRLWTKVPVVLFPKFNFSS